MSIKDIKARRAAMEAKTRIMWLDAINLLLERRYYPLQENKEENMERVSEDYRVGRGCCPFCVIAKRITPPKILERSPMGYCEYCLHVIFNHESCGLSTGEYLSKPVDYQPHIDRLLRWKKRLLEEK